MIFGASLKMSSQLRNVAKVARPCRHQVWIFYFFNLNVFILIGGKLLYNIVLVLPYIYMIPPRDGCTCVSLPEQPSHLPPHPIPLGHPSAPAPSTLCHTSNLDWWFVSYMIIFMFQCHSPKSSHPHPLPQSPKVRSAHLCLFCCLKCLKGHDISLILKSQN